MARQFHLVAMVALIAVVVAFAEVGPAAAQEVVTQTKESQAAMTPAEALRLLQAGNARFVADKPLRRDLAAQVKATSNGQYPFAAVLGCIDSRVPPELVFDTGIGDIFSTRTAGNVLDDEILGGLEFAAKVSNVRLIVVLGHTQCGAVKGACDAVELGHLT
jgi:carbonic anhydrase